MRIRFFHEGAVETNVDIGELIEAMFDRPDEYSSPLAQQLLLKAVTALQEMPDEEINKLPEITRLNIASILNLQARRYVLNVTDVRPELVEGQPQQDVALTTGSLGGADDAP